MLTFELPWPPFCRNKRFSPQIFAKFDLKLPPKKLKNMKMSNSHFHDFEAWYIFFWLLMLPYLSCFSSYCFFLLLLFFFLLFSFFVLLLLWLRSKRGSKTERKNERKDRKNGKKERKEGKKGRQKGKKERKERKERRKGKKESKERKGRKEERKER